MMELAPGGFAVDYGTQFAVRVNGQEDSFEVRSDELSVHHVFASDLHSEGSGPVLSLILAEEGGDQ